MAAKPRFDAFFNNWGGGGAAAGWVVVPPDTDLGDIEIEARLQGAAVGRIVVEAANSGKRVQFTVPCEQRFKAIDIVTGRLKLYARLGDGTETEVRAHETLQTWMAKVAFNEEIFAYIRDTASAKFILERLEGRFGPSLLSERGVETPSEPPADPARDVTPLLHRTGTISTDRTAILGRGGTLFLFEGSNKLYTQYQETELSVNAVALVEQWKALLGARIEKFRSAKLPFVQTIIPEKSSALAHLFPLPITAPTRMLDAVETWAKAEQERFGACFVSALECFRAAPGVDGYYLKTDSHFAARGAIATTRMLLAALARQNAAMEEALPAIDALLERAQAPTTPRRLVTGDLAARFFGVPLYEEDLDISYETLFGRCSSVQLTNHVVPPGANLNGMRLSWRHAEAPLPLRVLAFGNSFFERGSNCTTLSWWFKHLCREFHLVWSKDIDQTVIETLKPDLVIAQTIERFLTVVPAV
jgi:hypothetical protein